MKEPTPSRSDEPSSLFVYGTLKRGQLNCSLLLPYADSVEPASIPGRLYDIGPFPALDEGEGRVRGELVRVNPARLERVLRVLDELEGYWEGDLETSEYVRRIVEVRTETGEGVRAYAYFYNRLHRDLPPLESFPLVESGEWPGPSSDRARPATAVLDVFEEHGRTFSHVAAASEDVPVT